MASRARSNRPWYTIPMREGGPKWKRRKGRYLKGLYESRTKENRTRANRRERRKPIRMED